jgi:hypothetical protein
MLRWSSLLAAAYLLAGCAPAAVAPAPAPVRAAAERPIPEPVVAPPEFRRAIAAGTRTETGHPGPAYWTNPAAYRLRTRLLVPERRLEGSAEIAYTNRSPDALGQLHLELTMNHHAPGVVRNEPAEVTGGVELRRVAVNGTPLAAGAARPGYAVASTRMVIVPPAPVGPGETVRIEVDWAFAIPQAGAGGRMGYSRDDLFYLGYWYPHMAVYDDLGGWHPDEFKGTGEFYHGFADYDLEIDVPAGWVVRSTGELVNAEEVLAPAVLARLREAEGSDTPVRVVDAAEMARATPPGRDGRLTWRFRAENVRDVAFSATRNSNWDVGRAPVGDLSGDGRTDHTRVEALWRETAPRWARAAAYGQHSVRFLSDYTGLPYPYPHMTAVEGEDIIGGGMEFPMMTIIGPYTAASDTALYNVTLHEIAHNWAPMLASMDERRYGWMDEGMTVFHVARGHADMFPGSNAPEVAARRSYLGFAARGREGEMMRWSDFHYDFGAYRIASYDKPAVVFTALRGVLGEETFLRAWRAFFERWAYRHPQPWDLFNTFEDVSGEDLEWFWRTWFYETWLLDQAVASVTEGPGGTTIVVEDRGDAPMPARLTVTRADGSVERAEVPVSTWLSGARTATVTLPAAASPVVRVEIDAEHHFPDADRENNVWVAG